MAFSDNNNNNNNDVIFKTIKKILEYYEKCKDQELSSIDLINQLKNELNNFLVGLELNVLSENDLNKSISELKKEEAYDYFLKELESQKVYYDVLEYDDIFHISKKDFYSIKADFISMEVFEKLASDRDFIIDDDREYVIITRNFMNIVKDYTVPKHLPKVMKLAQRERDWGNNPPEPPSDHEIAISLEQPFMKSR